MQFDISQGPMLSATKLVLYAVEGIGKSTFASQFPNPLFIDTEGSTNTMNVRRLPAPNSWQMLLQEVQYVRDTSGLCATLVIDTIDWAERLCIDEVCKTHQKNGIEDFGYGAGYTYVYEAFGKLLNLLSDVVENQINVVLVAHSMIRKFEQPNEAAPYDRYQLKLIDTPKKSVANMVKEWADAVIFANYKTVVEKTDSGKAKARGNKRVMYAQHNACWDAKNRWGLAAELPFDYNEIAPYIAQTTCANFAHMAEQSEQSLPQTAQVATSAQVNTTPASAFNQLADQVIADEPKIQQMRAQTKAAKQATPAAPSDSSLPDFWTPALQLMQADGVTIDEIRKVAADHGHFTLDTPPENFPPDYITGFIVPSWQQILEVVKANRIDVPFN